MNELAKANKVCPRKNRANKAILSFFEGHCEV
jgi:hypothetical protein